MDAWPVSTTVTLDESESCSRAWTAEFHVPLTFAEMWTETIPSAPSRAFWYTSRNAPTEGWEVVGGRELATRRS